MKKWWNYKTLTKSDKNARIRLDLNKLIKTPLRMQSTK
jgi:hypothetical protein